MSKQTVIRKTADRGRHTCCCERLHGKSTANIHLVLDNGSSSMLSANAPDIPQRLLGEGSKRMRALSSFLSLLFIKSPSESVYSEARSYFNCIKASCHLKHGSYSPWPESPPTPSVWSQFISMDEMANGPIYRSQRETVSIKQRSQTPSSSGATYSSSGPDQSSNRIITYK